MKFIVGDKEFTDYNEAQAYEVALEKEKADRNKILAEVIEKNIHIIKFKDNLNNTTHYIAVGVDSEGVANGVASFPKNIAFAMLEKNMGMRYDYQVVNGYIKVTEKWGIEKITPDELNTVRLVIYNYLTGGERHLGKMVRLGENKSVIFYDMLYSVETKNTKQKESDVNSAPKSILELLDKIASGNIPSGFYKL